MNERALAAEVTDEQLDYQYFAIKRMDFVDGLEPAIRECVHDFGLDVVKAFLSQGINKAKSIRHIVHTILDQSRGTGPLNSCSKKILDRRAATWLAGAGFLVVPKIPSGEMIEASINALDDAGIAHTGVARSRKHAVRLIHANVVGHAAVAGVLS